MRPRRRTRPSSLLQQARRADAFDHQRGLAPEPTGQGEERVLVRRVEHHGGAKRRRQGAAAGEAVDDHHLGGTAGARPTRRREADGAGAEHDDVLAGLQRGDAERVPAHRQRLDERAGVAGEAGGEAERLAGADPDVLREGTGQIAGAERAQRAAAHAVALATRGTGAAGHVGQGADAFADAPALDPVADRRHLAGEFVAEHGAGRHRRRIAEQMQVGAAHPGGAHAQEQLTRPGRRIGHGRDAQAAAAVVDDRSAHQRRGGAASPMRNRRRVRSSHSRHRQRRLHLARLRMISQLALAVGRPLAGEGAGADLLDASPASSPSAAGRGRSSAGCG